MRTLWLPAILAGLFLFLPASAEASNCCGDEDEAQEACDVCTEQHEQAEQLAEVGNLLAAARDAANAEGASDTARKIALALAKVESARKQLASRAEKHQKASHPEMEAEADAVVNARCPMMGGKVDESLVREFRGRKVGFCCGGCPARWDRLSDAEKAARLEKVVESD